MNICDGAFFTSVKPYFKNVLNSIELPLSSIFYASHPFVKKTYNSENFGRISPLLTMEHFFSKFKIMQWDGIFNKQKQPPEVFFKKRCYQKFCKIHRKVIRVSSERETIKKETLAKLFSCEFCEIS